MHAPSIENCVEYLVGLPGNVIGRLYGDVRGLVHGAWLTARLREGRPPHVRAALERTALAACALPIPGSSRYRVLPCGHVVCGGASMAYTAIRQSGTEYPYITLSGRTTGDKRQRVHILTAKVFLGPARGRLVRHLDDDPSNHGVANLLYGTPVQNAQDRERNRRKKQT